ncbi:hypothetical protein Pres01_25170 [Metapseudomonas resinovorans]|nr:hypothetical protein Pres01_25170 [Pseudomonas resinovorans]
MPAIRPLARMNRLEDKPISAPPARALQGVKAGQSIYIGTPGQTGHGNWNHAIIYPQGYANLAGNRPG